METAGTFNNFASNIYWNILKKIIKSASAYYCFIALKRFNTNTNTKVHTMSVTDKHAQAANHIAAQRDLIEELTKHRHQLMIAVNCYIRQIPTKTKIEDINELVKKKGSDTVFVEQLEAMMKRNTISQNESLWQKLGYPK